MSCGKENDRYKIVLDQTVFYPEGGGQPSDTGQLVSGEGTSCPVFDVQYEGDSICHYTGGPLPVGSRVTGQINWERRFDLMQQHSGEHLLSGFIHQIHGYHNRGFHMGEDVITVDVSGVLTWEQAMELENRVNDYIWADKKTIVSFPSDEEREHMSYRSKKELTGEVRLVEFPGGDCCACCGLHVESTGQIGMIKILSLHHFREGVRMEMVAGKRAMTLFRDNFSENTKVAAALSVRMNETADAVGRLQEENYKLRGQIIQMKQEKAKLRAEQCRDKETAAVFEADMDAADVRKEADAIMKVCPGLCIVFAGDDESGYKYAAGQKGGDLRSFLSEMNEALHGRGGGKPFFVQGSLRAKKDEIDAFLLKKKITVL